ncbi:MAG: GNAT family N-acetyltransferase [Arachnia sp.]
MHEGAPPRLFHAVTIREARPDEWRQSRTLRLEMLADTPHSFGDHLHEVLGWDDDQWMIRHESHLLPDSGVFVAVAEDGRWMAHMGVREFHNYSPPRAWLMGVYVTPALRGTGTAANMLRAVESWTVDRGFDRLFLDVHEHALPARRFYEKFGFVPTGETLPYPLDPTTSELEMVKVLTPLVQRDGGASAPAGTPAARC